MVERSTKVIIIVHWWVWRHHVCIVWHHVASMYYSFYFCKLQPILLYDMWSPL